MQYNTSLDVLRARPSFLGLGLGPNFKPSCPFLSTHRRWVGGVGGGGLTVTVMETTAGPYVTVNEASPHPDLISLAGQALGILAT